MVRTINGYRYGFQGQESDDEVKGKGNSYTAEFWQYDSRLGRRWNTDPVVKVHESPYATFANNPIWFRDVNGADTSFVDNQAKKDFNETYDEVANTIKSIDKQISNLEQKAKDKGWSDKKLTRKRTPLDNQKKNWNSIKDMFDEIIESDDFHISYQSTGIVSSANGTTGDKGNGNISVKIRPGKLSTYVHESRHAFGIMKGELANYNGYDTQDEVVAFRMQSIFDPRHVRNFILSATIMYNRENGTNVTTLSLEEAVNFSYREYIKNGTMIKSKTQVMAK